MQDIFEDKPDSIDIRIKDNNIDLRPYKNLIKEGLIIQATVHLRNETADKGQELTLDRCKYIIYNLIIEMIDNDEIPPKTYHDRNTTPQEWRKSCVKSIDDHFTYDLNIRHA
jgi:hypothetical protein